MMMMMMMMMNKINMNIDGEDERLEMIRK